MVDGLKFWTKQSNIVSFFVFSSRVNHYAEATFYYGIVWYCIQIVDSRALIPFQPEQILQWVRRAK